MAERIFYELALPDDSSLDVFSSGSEVADKYFRTRQWFNVKKREASPPTYVFRTEKEGETIGYCATAFGNRPHPNGQSDVKARYLVIYMIGVNVSFQGEKNALAPEETYAHSIMAVLEEMAKSRRDCVGLILLVRPSNERAIGLYEKVGFKVDPPDAALDGGGEPMLTMRKIFI